MKVFILLLIICLIPVAYANDGYSAIGTGGIEFKHTNDIQLRSEILTISMDNISVKYQFYNDSAGPIHATVSFPLPKITCGYWGKNASIDDFKAIVDGKAVTLKKEEKAFAYPNAKDFGKDITAQVKAAGLPIDCRKVNADKDLFKKAQKAKLADDFHGTDAEDLHYATQIIYYWEQDFPSKTPISIEHSYKPMTGEDAGEVAPFYLNMAPHWDRDIHVRWIHNNSMDYQVSDIKGDTIVQYILTTAKTWKYGVADFHLILKRKSPTVFVGSTLGPLTKVDDNTLEFRAKDFVPDRDLTVIFSK